MANRTRDVPNKLTAETLDKSDRGEDIQEFSSVEELFEELDQPET